MPHMPSANRGGLLPGLPSARNGTGAAILSRNDVSRLAFLVCFGLLCLVVGIYIGEHTSVVSWSDGYRTGYARCEGEFWVQHQVVLSR